MTLWLLILGIIICGVLIGYTWPKPERDVIPYKRIHECKPGAFSVGKDLK